MQIFGSSLILLVGLGIGRLSNEGARESAATTRALLYLLRFVRGQIDSFCLPREQIFARLEHPYLARTGFLDALRESGSLSVSAARLVHLSCEAKALLVGFDGELGRGYQAEQLRVCDYYIEQMKQLLEAEEARLPARTRVTRTVSLSLAAMVVLLLL